MITMYAPQNNSPQTALAEALGSGGTTITVEDASVLPAAPNVLTIGTTETAELVLCTNITENILTVERGFNGTTPQAWGIGAPVYRAVTAYDIGSLQDNLREHVNDEVRHITEEERELWNTPVEIPVVSVFGRTGEITAQAGDYTAAQVGAVPTSGGDMTGPLGLTAYKETVTTLSGTVIDPTVGGVFVANVAADTTYTIGGSLESGKAYSIVLVLAFGDTLYTVGLPDTVSWIGDAPTFEAGKTYEVVLRTYNGGTRWHASCGGGV